MAAVAANIASMASYGEEELSGLDASCQESYDSGSCTPPFYSPRSPLSPGEKGCFESDGASTTASEHRGEHKRETPCGRSVRVGGKQSRKTSSQGQADDLKDVLVLINKIEGIQLGIDVDRSDGTTLLIRSVTDGGLIDRWNQDNPQCQVAEGDRIVTVNGISCVALDMLRECKRSQFLSMRVCGSSSPKMLADCMSRLKASKARAAKLSSMRSSKRLGPIPDIPAHSNSEDQGTESHDDQGTSAPVANVRIADMVPPPSAATLDGTSIHPSVGASSVVPTGKVLVDEAGSCGELSEVLSSIARTISASPGIQSVQVLEGMMGGSSTIHIGLPLVVAGNSSQAQIMSQTSAYTMRTIAKQTLLDATNKSHKIFLLGGNKEPFQDHDDFSFKATLAFVPWPRKSCYDYLENGFCKNPASCSRSHPAEKDTMVVSVHFHRDSGAHQAPINWLEELAIDAAGMHC